MFDNLETAIDFTPALGLPGVEADKGSARFANVRPLDVYYWERVSGPICYGGHLHETWCYVECAGGTCQVLWCEDRTVGSC